MDSNKKKKEKKKALPSRQSIWYCWHTAIGNQPEYSSHYTNLTEDGNVLNVIIVGQRLDEAIAEAWFSQARLAAFLFRAGQANHGDI